MIQSDSGCFITVFPSFSEIKVLRHLCNHARDVFNIAARNLATPSTFDGSVASKGIRTVLCNFKYIFVPELFVRWVCIDHCMFLVSRGQTAFPPTALID